MFLHASILCFVFFRMGNFTSSTTGGSSTACVQYVQVRRPCGVCCGSLDNLVLPVFDHFPVCFHVFLDALVQMLISCLFVGVSYSQPPFLGVVFSLFHHRFDVSLYIFKSKVCGPRSSTCNSICEQTVSKKLPQTKPWRGWMYPLLFTQLLNLPLTSTLTPDPFGAVCLCVWGIFNQILILPDLSGNGGTELRRDIFQDDLSLLQNGQECVQWNWCDLQSGWTGRAQWREESARSLSSDDWCQNGKSLVL